MRAASASSPSPPRNSPGEKGKVTGLKTVQVEFKDGKLAEVPGTEKDYKADLVLLAMGFVSPVATVLDAFGVDKDARGNARATTDFDGGYATNVPKVFAAGDMRRGQSLVVWAIREGRQAARAVDEFLMGLQRPAALSEGAAAPLTVPSALRGAFSLLLF
jgi:glutamate synthase (NADPH/NADH) small chain